MHHEKSWSAYQNEQSLLTISLVAGYSSGRVASSSPSDGVASFSPSYNFFIFFQRTCAPCMVIKVLIRIIMCLFTTIVYSLRASHPYLVLYFINQSFLFNLCQPCFPQAMLDLGDMVRSRQGKFVQSRVRTVYDDYNAN